MDNKIDFNSDQDYTLMLIYKCNWNCSYCIVDTHESHKLKPIHFSDVESKLALLPDGLSVTLTGGEIGTLFPDQIAKVFSALIRKNITISVYTNGLFIKKYPSYLESVEHTLYHCLEDLEHGHIEFPNLDQQKIQYVLIITNKNYIHVEKVLDRYPHIKFVLLCNYKRGEQFKRSFAFKLFMDNKYRIHEDSFNSLWCYSCEVSLI